jgi:hypothetical protein
VNGVDPVPWKERGERSGQVAVEQDSHGGVRPRA